MIKSSKLPIIVFTDYGAILGITKQTSLITTNINKINLRFIRVLNYLQRFDLFIRYKLGKQYIVLDTLSRLENTIFIISGTEGEFNIL